MDETSFGPEVGVCVWGGGQWAGVEPLGGTIYLTNARFKERNFISSCSFVPVLLFVLWQCYIWRNR